MTLHPRALRNLTALRWLLLLPLPIGCVPDGDPDDSAEPAQDVSAEVSAAVDRYMGAVTTRDTAAIRGLLAGDGRLVWLENGAVAYRTQDELLGGLAAFPPETPIRTVLGALTVAPLGGGAAHAWTSFTTTIGEGEQAFSFGGMLSFVWERSDTGWILVGGHTSSPEE